jgi:hypothetical protein
MTQNLYYSVPSDHQTVYNSRNTHSVAEQVLCHQNRAEQPVWTDKLNTRRRLASADADSLITLTIIDERLDIDLHRWTPVRG